MRLAADANDPLSALIGGRARLVLTHSEVTEVLTTENVLAEVREYLPSLALKRKLDPAPLLLSVATLPVTLALHLRIPIWSNDDDFAAARAPGLTTAELLARLGI